MKKFLIAYMDMNMNRDIEKNYDPKTLEDKWYKIWEERKAFSPDKKKDKVFSIIMPPPNVTGILHMGHALNTTCQDVLVRHKRMSGYNTLWIPGTDHAGIATQAKVEKKIFKEEKKTKHDLGREDFLKRIWEWKEEHGDEIVKQLKKLGASCDWDYETFTMDEGPNKAVRKVFTKLYNEGLIYKDKRIINWDTVLQSAISDAEVEYKEVKGKFYHIHYQVEGSDEVLEVATTRPETLFGDTAVAVNPKDPRFKKLIGKNAIIPICERVVPIVGDSYVDMELGTGCLKVTPAHDFNDFEIGKRHDLEVINILHPDGKLNQHAKAVEGLSAQAARKKTIEILKEKEILVDVKEHKHQVGHGERSDSVIEPMVSTQWFLNVQDMAKKSLQSVKKEKMNFVPKQWENTFFGWMKEPRDWCLSRQLWWGHRIPVYTCKTCEYEFSFESEPSECPKCQSRTLIQDPDVLDTWFSSGLWPLSTLGWPVQEEMDKKGFDTYFPNTMLITAFDIIFFWVARMSMMNIKLMNTVPFKDVYIHGLVRDKQGRKMSKSLGNGINPLDLIEQYGCDAMRFTLANGCGFNRGFNLDPKLIESSRNFMNKIWNAFRFISPFLRRKVGNYKISTRDIDIPTKWILTELNSTAHLMNKHLEAYRFDEAASTIYSFVYDKFCSWYLELSKPVLYSDDQAIVKKRAEILRFLFEELLKLLHPISPFITEEIWSYFYEDRLIINQDYPVLRQEYQFDHEHEKMAHFIELVTQIRNLRASVGLKPKEQIELEFFTDDKKTAEFIHENRHYLESLAQVKKGTIHNKDAKRPQKSTMATTSLVETFLPLEGLIDIAEEVARLNKQIDKVKSELEKVNKKIQNKNFMDRAPEEVVLEVRTKAKDFQTKLDALEANLSSLE